MKRIGTLFFLSYRLFAFGRKGEKLTRPLLGSILGIALSLIPLIVVLFISEGMIRGITERTLETGSYHLQAYPYSTHSMEEMKEEAVKLESLGDVRSTSLEKRGFGLLYSPHSKMGITIRSVEKDFYSSDEGVRQYLELIEGTFEIDDSESIVIGRDMARKLQIQVGEEVKVLTGKFFSNGRFLPKVSKFVVKGIFTTGYDELDRMWVFVPLETGDKILADNSSYQMIGIKTLKPYDTLQKDVLTVRESLPSRWNLRTWESINRSTQENYKTTRMLLLFIMALIVCVAIINISSSLVMLVLEKQEEIAVLKCLGASPDDITQSYIFTGAITGVAGTVIGILTGLVISLRINQILRFLEGSLTLILTGIRKISAPFTGIEETVEVELLNSSYYLDVIPINFELAPLLLIGLGTIFLSIFSSALPARRAGKIKPLEVLRKH